MKKTREVPADLVLLLKGLGTELGFQIAVTLMDEGSLSIDQIAEKVRGDKVATESCVRELDLGGVVRQYLSKSGFSYEITSLGRRMVTSVIDGYNSYYGAMTAAT